MIRASILQYVIIRTTEMFGRLIIQTPTNIALSGPVYIHRSVLGFLLRRLGRNNRPILVVTGTIALVSRESRFLALTTSLVFAGLVILFTLAKDALFGRV